MESRVKIEKEKMCKTCMQSYILTSLDHPKDNLWCFCKYSDYVKNLSSTIQKNNVNNKV
jgi:hypothetical protein